MDENKILVLSPHLDDAVLSCGGFIAERIENGKHVIVFNLFCAPYQGPLSPLAQELHASWGNHENIATLRLEEDRRALELLGADRIIGDVPDLIYRKNDAGKWLYQNMVDIQGMRNPCDDHLVDQYFRKINLSFPPQSTCVCAPLGIGAHIDHLIAYDIGVKLARSGYMVEFYEDLPYALRKEWLQERLFQIEGMKTKLHFFSLSNLRKKVIALRFYASQIVALFTDENKMEEYLTAQALQLSGQAELGAEKFWRFD